MKLLGLIPLSLILMLASEGHTAQTWNASVTRNIKATFGSNVIIKCSFTVPKEYSTGNVQVYWKKFERSNFKRDKDPDAYVFHPNETYVNKEYKGKTMLLGNKTEGNCSLMIFNFTDGTLHIYLRVTEKKEMFSFRGNSVQITESDITQPLPTEISKQYSTMTTVHETSTTMYTAIFVPVAALLIIIFVAGIVFYLKRTSRSQPLTREESGYYANCSRVSSNQGKRKASSKNQEKENTSELKAIDEPVYINIEAPPDQMGQQMNHTENIYGNVDYS